MLQVYKPTRYLVVVPIVVYLVTYSRGLDSTCLLKTLFLN